MTFSAAAPYCADFNTTYTGAGIVTASTAVDSADACSDSCSIVEACSVWELTVNVADNAMTCVHYDNATGTTFDPNTDPAVITFVGDGATCKKAENLPASPEDAQVLTYREVCQDNQYQEEIMAYDDWDIATCPSPCDKNGNCTKHAKCIDNSTIAAPNFYCVCQMGMIMEGGRCISPPPATEEPRADPTLSPGAKSTATILTRTASFILIGFIIATLILFAFFKILNTGRFIHMNIEIALLIAHICLLPDLAGNEVRTTY